MLRFKKNRKHRRRGAVAVEFALTAPIFFGMIFVAVEFSRVHSIQCAVENACFEGARKGIIPGASASTCESHARDLLNFAGLKIATITVDPAVIDANVDLITVSIDVPLSAENGFGISGFLKDQTLSKVISLPRERHGF